MKRLHLLTFALIGALASLPFSASAEPDAKAIREAILNPKSDRVLVVAHRALSGKSTGAWERHPENSLSAIRESIEKGIDILEIDVRKTKDGELVLMHDSTIDRTTDGKGKVSDLTLEQLRSYHLKLGLGGSKAEITDETIPTLTEVMETVRGKCMVNLDKAGSLFGECSKVLKETHTSEQAIIKSGDSAKDCAIQLKKLDRHILFMPVLSGKGADQTEEAMTQWIDSYRPLHPVAYELVFDDDRDPIVAPATIAAIQKQGARVWINSLWASLNGGHDDARSLKYPKQGWSWLMDHGATIIQSDESETLIGYLTDQGKRGQ
ncbi:glycerophosphodiester phosphodiesterase family protein [Luteolibacter pohnpeiensis]|uniref:Glycerophosphodiester phosphodiesterase family protein n=1 Tax=Luteolibacter pohnpeiensis TaxID=454153 RepID=A0A934VRL5_9BACT|nr:glycerophosphodiester phosphodiesterase family protein [Luteolibacter pohnpeiensis]MBK1883341.1 glycerophosphodiester phosphodiesterase family protein [Luteolibacter pohnpeiensis]